jgi:ubiquinone/menaquinone biosynthesis C-methylase UbiE
VEQIGKYLQPHENTCILDYGCGVGRLAKALIETYNCWIMGVDISASMRQLAMGYVGSPRFSACSPEALEVLVTKGFAADHAISIWVIQHCLRPQEDIARIKAAVKRGGLGYILNSRFRVVPTDKGWVNDGIDVMETLRREFVEVERYAPPEEITHPAYMAFVSVLKKG